MARKRVSVRREKYGVFLTPVEYEDASRVARNGQDENFSRMARRLIRDEVKRKTIVDTVDL